MRSLSYFTRFAFALCLLVGLGFAPNVHADTLKNKAFNVTFYIGDAHSVGNTQTFCFRANNTWDSPTYPWTGYWHWKGNEVWIWGDYIANNEMFAAIGTFFRKPGFSGNAVDWFPPANPNGGTVATFFAARKSFSAFCGTSPTVAPEPPLGSLGVGEPPEEE